MPDPHKDLADIIEPQIPVVAATSNDWLFIAGGLLLGIALIGSLYWQWRRHAPLRALQRLRKLSDPQCAADELAALMPQFRASPDPVWLDELNRLRFGPAHDDAPATLARLCAAAEPLLRPGGRA